MHRKFVEETCKCHVKFATLFKLTIHCWWECRLLIYFGNDFAFSLHIKHSEPQDIAIPSNPTEVFTCTEGGV